MATKIYLWEATRLKGFGHIALELSDGTYMSWWPEEEMKTLMEAVKGSKAKWFEDFQSEFKVQGSPSKTFYLSGLDEEKIKAYFKQLLKGSTKWDLTTRSCSAKIYQALCEGSDWFKDRAGKIATPTAVAELAEAYANKEEKKIVLGSCCKKKKCCF